MINKLLHALTNRKTISADPIFAADPEFTPANLTPEAKALRTALCLDYTNTDYYLKVYAAILAAYPDIEAQLGDTVRTYDVRDFLPPGVTIEGARLMSNTVSGLYTDLQPTSLPVGLTYHITQNGSHGCIIKQVETGATVSAPCTSVTDSVNSFLTIDWPKGIPFSGPMVLDAPWDTGSAITICVEPSRFPFSDACRRLEREVHFLQLLTEVGVLQMYQSTLDVREKLALALLAVAVSNPSVYLQ